MKKNVIRSKSHKLSKSTKVIESNIMKLPKINIYLFIVSGFDH